MKKVNLPLPHLAVLPFSFFTGDFLKGLVLACLKAVETVFLGLIFIIKSYLSLVYVQVISRLRAQNQCIH